MLLWAAFTQQSGWFEFQGGLACLFTLFITYYAIFDNLLDTGISTDGFLDLPGAHFRNIYFLFSRPQVPKQL